MGYVIALRRYTVDLIEEDDSPLLLSGSLEESPQHFLTLSVPLAKDLGAGYLKESRSGLRSDDPSEHGLAGSWLSCEEDSLDRASTDIRQLFVLSQWNLDQLASALDDLDETAEVVES